MEKFREFAIEFYTKTQNKPLSEAQHSIIQNALHRLLPLLSQTPEHPPYAWMILKAIEELGENGDSSEESISDYIKKQYKDLPWAHDTLLNHHLKNLCTSGDIVLTRNQTYVLPVLHSNHKSRHKSSKKKHVRKKQDWDWDWCKMKNTRQKRRFGKVYTKQKEDKSHLIAEERPEGQKVPTEVHEIKIADLCSSDSQLNPKEHQINAETHLIVEHRSPCDSDEQASKNVQAMQLVDICSSDAKLNLKGKKLDDLKTDTSTPHRPPSFGSVLESIILPGNSQEFAMVAPELSCTRREQVYSRANDELKQVQSVPSEVSETKDQGEEHMLLSSNGASDSHDQYMQALQPITTITDIGLQQIQYGENRAMLTQVELTEVCNQQTIPELRSTTDEPLHCSGADQVRRIVYQYKKRPPGWKSKENRIKKQRLEEFEPLEQVQKQLDEKPIFLLDPQYSKTIDSNKPQVLSGSANGSHQELQFTWQDDCLIQEMMHQGTRMQRKLRSWKNNSADGPQEKPLKGVLQTLGPSIPQNQQNMNHLLTGPTQAPSEGASISVEKHKDEVEYQELRSGTPLKHEPQKSEFCCRGRSRNYKPECRDSATKPSYTAEEVPLSDPAHILHLEKMLDKPKHQGRGRPRKINAVPHSVINKNLASRVLIHKPGYRGRGRPRKIIQ